MEEWIIQSMGEWGMIGIFLLMAAENVFPPIPSEIVLTCAGFLTTCSKLTKPQAIISATLGSLLGAVILYGLGRILPVEKLQKFGFKREEIESATAWFNKKGKIAVLLCRCVPVVRSLISVPAGAARMPMSSFLPLTVLGTLTWDAVLILVGAQQVLPGRQLPESSTMIQPFFFWLLFLCWLPAYRFITSIKKRKKQ